MDRAAGKDYRSFASFDTMCFAKVTSCLCEEEWYALVGSNTLATYKILHNAILTI